MKRKKYFVDIGKEEDSNNYSAILFKKGRPIKTLYLGTSKKTALSFKKLKQKELEELKKNK